MTNIWKPTVLKNMIKVLIPPKSKYIYARDEDSIVKRKPGMNRCDVGNGYGDILYEIDPPNPWFFGKIL